GRTGSSSSASDSSARRGSSSSTLQDARFKAYASSGSRAPSGFSRRSRSRGSSDRRPLRPDSPGEPGKRKGPFPEEGAKDPRGKGQGEQSVGVDQAGQNASMWGCAAS